MKVQDNYIPSVYQAEVQDANEIAEQNDFLDAVMNTEVMKLAETFLHSKSELKILQTWLTFFPSYQHLETLKTLQRSG